MARSVPQLVAAGAIVVGLLLFVLTLAYIDLDETIASAGQLGLALPLILLPGVFWHLLRTWGWAIAFPDETRPPFARLFRVRLAADAISFFTIRGLAGEPLKAVLLYDRVAPEVTMAAVAFERLAFAVVGIAMAGLVSAFAVASLQLPGTWDAVFTLLSLTAVLLAVLVVHVARRRSGDYLGRLVQRVDRVTGKRIEASRIVKFVLDVEDVLLTLVRGDRRRLFALALLPVVCYLLMALEVGLVFWAIGRPISVTEGLTVETFARLASVASAAIPGNLGALEASNAAVAGALGLAGGGALALARRIRSLLWAAVGLAVYPRVRNRNSPQPSRADASNLAT